MKLKALPCHFLLLLMALLTSVNVMADDLPSGNDVSQEAAAKNTPSGWTEVDLPNIVTITSSNTYDITSYGASTTSSDNASAIQSAYQRSHKCWRYGRHPCGRMALWTYPDEEQRGAASRCRLYAEDVAIRYISK